jgi:hypothetical protein
LFRWSQAVEQAKPRVPALTPKLAKKASGQADYIIGQALHMIQDSFAPAKVYRGAEQLDSTDAADKCGEIYMFQNYVNKKKIIIIYQNTINTEKYVDITRMNEYFEFCLFILFLFLADNKIIYLLHIFTIINTTK